MPISMKNGRPRPASTQAGRSHGGTALWRRQRQLQTCLDALQRDRGAVAANVFIAFKQALTDGLVIIHIGGSHNQDVVRLSSHKKALLINGSFVKGMIANGKMPAKPFMRPAVEAEKPKIEESIKKVLQ